MPTFYELCQSGGQFFIRRTRRVRQKAVIHESLRTTYASALATWTDLLNGAAH
ncbi:hypothetical protein AB0K16_15085 [Nonomuraea jabiensis]|uniref:hypothetical protein n=1 Tax=Nonomuraea jabiensis TaxID=882448 RepID=UPI00343F9C8D